MNEPVGCPSARSSSQSCALTLLAAALLLLPASLPAVAAAPSGVQHKLSVGARVHGRTAKFEDYPFDRGDLSYGVAYEAHEPKAFWQIALGYTPDAAGPLTGEDDTRQPVDYVLTPELNLMAKDDARPWQGGLGVLASYMAGDDMDEWTPVYWQFLLGLRMPVARLELSIMAFYIFEDFGSIGKFDGKDIEYGGWLSFSF